MKVILVCLALICTYLPYGCDAGEFRDLLEAMQTSAMQHLECATKYGHYEAEMFYWKGQLDAYTLALMALDDCESRCGDCTGDR